VRRLGPVLVALALSALAFSGCSWLARLIYSPSCGENPCQQQCGCMCYDVREKCQ